MSTAFPLKLPLLLLMLSVGAAAASDWQLADAVHNDNSARADRLLDQGSNPNSRDRSGTPALVWAAARSQHDTLRQLLGAGANPNLADGNGVTALMWAAWHGDIDVIDSLLEAGADPNASDRYGFTALWVGSYNSAGDIAFAEHLLQAGASPDSRGPEGQTALMLSASRGLTALGQTLLQAGASQSQTDQQQRTPLHHALLNGHRGLLPSLLRGADTDDLNAIDSIGLSPLLIAISQGDLNLISILLDAGADANGGNGPSPLAMSIGTSLCRGQPAETLLRHSADANGRDQYDKPALLLAVQQGCHGLVDRLLESGADINARDSSGTGVLSSAINNGQTRLALLLLERGAHPASGTGQPSAVIALLQHSPNATALLERLLLAGASANVFDASGTPALVLAARSGNLAAIRLLSATINEIDVADRNGNTALMTAASSGNRALIELLLAAGADPQRRDSAYTESAINKARMAGHQDIETILLNHQTAKEQARTTALQAPMTARAQ